MFTQENVDRLAREAPLNQADRNDIELAEMDQILKASDSELVEALGRAGLGQWFAELGPGLDTIVGANGRGVSGGERARLGLARGLLSRRPVLLLDEPVAHLDHATAEAVLGDLTGSTTGHSVVMVTHRRDGLAGFDRVIDLSSSAKDLGRPGSEDPSR